MNRESIEGAISAVTSTVYTNPTPAELVAFSQMHRNHANAVRKAIWEIIGPCDDIGADLDTVLEIEQDVWCKIYFDLPNWTTPGYSLTPGRSPAKLSTRLFTFARLQAMGWRTVRLRELEKLGLRRRKVSELEQVTASLPFDYAAKFLCAQCNALQSIAVGYVVGPVADPALALRCGHVRRLSGPMKCDQQSRAAA